MCKGERLIEKPISWLFSKYLSGSLECWFIMTVGRWSWKSKSAKECVTTHLPNELALKMDGAKADYRYQAIKGSFLKSEIREFSWNISLVQILVEVATIQMRTLKTEVEKGFLSTVIVQDKPWNQFTWRRGSLKQFKRVFISLFVYSKYLYERTNNRIRSLSIVKNAKNGNNHNVISAQCFEYHFGEIHLGPDKWRGNIRMTLLGYPNASQEGNLTRAVHLLLNLNADVQRQAQREQKSLVDQKGKACLISIFRKSRKRESRGLSIPLYLQNNRIYFLMCIYIELFLSLGRRSLKVSDCSPANRERKLGLDLREIVGSDNWYSNWLTNQCCEAKSVG
ncbi:hypothetical protein MKS88_001284 [Plasmodium brasilianum]|uniref:Uncharacterized protein n=1 Tax=Plasmodium brasilianum TaxID=5824 RepID=A0ACB9YDP1_PLABR|nr:hypothetical protein MKS88_001284 [Plasmodium brasilianum]